MRSGGIATARVTALHTEARDHNRALGSTRVPQLVAEWYADMALAKSAKYCIRLHIRGYFNSQNHEKAGSAKFSQFKFLRIRNVPRSQASYK